MTTTTKKEWGKKGHKRAESQMSSKSCPSRSQHAPIPPFARFLDSPHYLLEGPRFRYVSGHTMHAGHLHVDAHLQPVPNELRNAFEKRKYVPRMANGPHTDSQQIAFGESLSTHWTQIKRGPPHGKRYGMGGHQVAVE